MKKIMMVLLFGFPVILFGQNVGIGTANPFARLQINHQGNTTIGLQLADSGASRLGSIKFSSISHPIGMYISGNYFSSFNKDHFLYISSDSSIVTTFRGDGSMGIRNFSPQYPLDVTGDINTTGTIRANGTAGSSGQVLESNGDGTMQWSSVCEYKNTVSFYVTPGSPWVVPAGVTKIMIEGWGAGGGGTAYGGGGGGGYIRAWLDVTPGDNFTIQVGTGGNGSTTTGVNGGNTFITAPIGLFTATGGQGSLYTAPAIANSGGGIFDYPPGFQHIYGEKGKAGTAQQFAFNQAGATVFYETIHGGRGGNAGNADNNGGEGPVVVYNSSTTTITRYSLGGGARQPGGGGAPGYAIITGGGTLGGGFGANGLVMIHY
ncbi:MAG TPA: hypothetical protein VGO58_02870 [Chitinophagaceae bacterium]|nr:hypothetical protein [Chitinophagaceae bacterium]